jgi:hypothetical protein
MIQRHLGATLEPDISGCFDMKVRRMPSFLVSRVVCTCDAPINKYQSGILNGASSWASLWIERNL